MKAKIDLSTTFFNQSKITSRRKLSKPNSNNKSFLSSSQTIDNIYKKNEQKRLINNDFLNKAIKPKISKIIHNKDKKENFDNNFLNKTNFNKNTLTKAQSYTQISLMNKKINLTANMYERIIERLFNYMKIRLPRETFQDINNRYMKEISKEFKSSSKKHFSPQNDLSINFIKSTATNSLNDSNTNSTPNLRLSFSNLNKFNQSKKHSSLYSLTKMKILNSKAISPSKSKSKSKSYSKSSKSNSKDKSNITVKNNSKKISNYGINQIEIIKDEKSNQLNNRILIKKKKFINCKKKNLYEKKRDNLNNSSNKNNITYFEHNEIKEIKEPDSLSTERRNKIKNSEQLKFIKSTIDDKLKNMFNFSYELFLNKESESDSKKEETIQNIIILDKKI
jgi:hypothetical protein